MEARQPVVEEFLADEEMALVASAEGLASIAATIWVDGVFAFGQLRSFDRTFALGGKKRAISGISSGHDAVEHVDATCDTVQKIVGCSHTH